MDLSAAAPKAAAAGLALAGIVPTGSLLVLLALPVAVWTCAKVVRHYADRSLAKASAGTIGLHLLAGLLTSAGLALFAVQNLLWPRQRTASEGLHIPAVVLTLIGIVLLTLSHDPCRRI